MHQALLNCYNRAWDRLRLSYLMLFFVFLLIGLTDIWNAKIFKHHQMSINAFLLLGVFKRLLI